MKECIENLQANGFIVKVVENKQEALEFAKAQIKTGIKIGLGGSVTVQQIGLLNYLTSVNNIELCNQYEEGISVEENNERRRAGLLSDLYITGVNAITRNGELVNVDGSGNRVAAQIYGPNRVLLFAGINKITDNLETAIERINKVAIVKNLERINEKAAMFGKKEKYTAQTLANKYTFINGEENGRTTIVIVKEELGF